MFGIFKSEKQRLKERLRKYKFPDGFVNRLRVSQGWAARQTEENVSKYLKFLYLAKYYGPVTPSKAVDEVWHLHLLYSDDYWNNLCKKVLKMNLHHTPGTGSSDEDKKFKRQYEDTNSAYYAEFPSADADLWGLFSEGDSNTFGGGSFGGGGAGGEWDPGHASCSNDSSGDGSDGSSCGGSSCSSSCGGSCGGD